MRKIRVYDGDGDFVIEVPQDAKITFHYFNPASAGSSGYDKYGGRGNTNASRETALRIYEGKTERSGQIAVFLGVTGFRDESIKLTRMVEEVKIMQTYENDGEGDVFGEFSSKRVVKAIKETNGYS